MYLSPHFFSAGYNNSLGNKDGIFSSYNSTEKIATYQKENADITIITDEGDRVTISANSELDIGCYSYSSLVNRNGSSQNVQEKSFISKYNSNISFSVDGDLNSQEYEDVLSVLNTIDSIMENALSDGTDPSLGFGEGIDELDSISAIDASLEVEKSITVEKEITIEASSTEYPHARHGKSRGKRIGQIVNRIMDAIEQAQIESHKMIDPMDKYMSGLIEALTVEDTEVADRKEIARLVRSGILGQMKTGKKGLDDIIPDPLKDESAAELSAPVAAPKIEAPIQELVV